ncbi:hypothetical protein SEPCBS57363_002608 [Sporothrix epigloea]|uniref:Mus7/MMS22 family protein n=1 Tax=Sporothrix epigloea TaxID=1892477 RepID=A0ABP0DGT0_9PEZI
MERKWQRLGVVPDSDDEEFDSQELKEDASFEAENTADRLVDELSATRDPRPFGGSFLQVLLSPRVEVDVAKSRSSHAPSTTRSSRRRPQARSSTTSRLSSPFDDSEDELNLVSDGSLGYGQLLDPVPTSLPRLNDSTTIRKQSQLNITDGMIFEPIFEEDMLPEQPKLSPPSRPLQRLRQLSKSQSPQSSPPGRSFTPHKSQTPRRNGHSKQVYEASILADPFSFSPSSTLSSLSRSPSPLPDSHLLRAATDQVDPHMSSPFPDVPDSPPEFRLGFLRSLRPRKPIQQHPYLLEGAQYAQAMKSHGVKPVRPEYISNTRKAAEEETLQDQEFRQPEELQLTSQQQSRAPLSAQDSVYDFPSSQAELVEDITPFITSPSTPTPVQQFTPLDKQFAPDIETYDLSLPFEDDFSTPATFQLQKYKRLQSRAAKRQGLSEISSAAKRARTLDTVPKGTPKPKWIPVRMDSSPDQPSRLDVQVHPVPPQPPLQVTRSPAHDISIISDDDENYNGNNSETVHPVEDIASLPRSETEGSQSDSEAVRKNSRRIKGVLPASWLRLDQHKAPRVSTDKSLATQRLLGQKNDQLPRKGVALRRQGQSASSVAALLPLLDASDEGNDNLNDSVVDLEPVERSPPVETPTNSAKEEHPPYYHVIDDDDIGSVMEDNSFDRMAPGAKRSRQPAVGGPRTKKPRMRTSSLFHGNSNHKTRQPKITNAMSRSLPLPTGANRRPGLPKHSTHEYRSLPKRADSKIARKRSSAPPMLSILDFAVPAAPDFIRVAARTARQRSALGKTSPSRKVINMGSRGDNVDALSVLQNWRAGKIIPKIQNPTRRPRPSGQQPPLKELSPNLPPNTVPRPAAAPGFPASTKNQTQLAVSRVPQTSLAAPLRPPNLRIKMATRLEAVRKPAQLETAAKKVQSIAAFSSKKKQLDEMYSRRKHDAVPLPNVRLEQFIDDQASFLSVQNALFEDGYTHPPTSFTFEQQGLSKPGQCDDNSKAGSNSQRARQRTKYRKSYVPRQVDVSAPRFACALDPIPVEIEPVTVDLAVDNTDPTDGKLRGLGPFGSQYSQHFDIFPLDSDITFHRSTLIGSGRLGLALGISPLDESDAATQVNLFSSFQLDERTLCWTSWDEVSSSEFGITIDWLSDILFSSAPSSVAVEPKVHALVNFLVDFIQSALSAPNFSPSVQKAFVQRTMEVFKSFMARFEATGFQQGHAAVMFNNSHLAALTGIVVIVSWLLQICRNTADCTMLLFPVEDLLRAACKLSAKALLIHGLDGIRSTYVNLQRGDSRSRSIRRDKQALCSWVILMQVLEHAKIPRAGFWDVTYSVMLANKAINTCGDAGPLERLWEDMFTLLPLGEVDSTGAVRPRMRHVLPLDGWELPKKALERVFQFYKANPHQSPSFNAYCRAVVGRCHYLVQAWGWRRCKTIVGTIFDFYGSQDFAHLRNEEAHRSPRFLEELASSPSLAIDSDDKCFHIFIKMLGLIIQQMKRLGQFKEMTNLVSRILPNHDRQYLKEKDVHERDLAALRNHHDLLCTLYWASSPDIRPPIHQIEKLVVPANSHKEACLINIRAWKQLAQFVIATDEGYDVYKGFHWWMKNIFQQMLDQYLSAESDMHRQFQNLFSPMMQGINPDMIKAMAAANRATAMNVLHACIVASLDVLRYAKSLSVATYCFSSDQLCAVFTQLDLPDPKTNWRILGTALDVLEHYLDRLEKAMDEQYSSLADTEDPQVADDAVLMLDHRLAKDFFRFNKTITHMSWDNLSQPAAVARNFCTERSVVVAARLVSRFVHSGVYGLSRFFGSGDYCIFERLPHAPGLLQRKFVPLFVSALIRSNVFDFKDLGTSILELWMLAIVKPQRFLAYEHRFAEVLKQHDLPYVRQAHVPPGDQAPSYHTNGLFFDCAMMSLRQQLQDADGTARRQQLRSDFARALKMVMQQMKGDLKFAKAQPVEHEQYIVFVRYIVALIRSHGSDICPLDSFFYDQSQDFSPSPEDPQLRAASIVMYGLRLGEGEVTAAPQLFHYLLNNFNIALANGKLDQECKFLERSMENDNVLGFMLERMLPAILRATRLVEEAWPLLNVYYSAMERLLTRSPVPKDIGDENTTVGVVGLLEDIVAWLQWAAPMLAADAAAAGITASDAASSGGDTQPTSICVRVHAMAQLVALANLLQPFLMVCSCLPGSPATQSKLDGAITGFSLFIDLILADIQAPSSKHRRRYAPLNNADPGHSDASDQQIRRTLFSTLLKTDINVGMPSGMRGSENTTDDTATITTTVSHSGGRARVDEFSKKIVQNVRENWVVNGAHLMVRNGIRHGVGETAVVGVARAATTAGSPPGPMSTGVPFGPWSMEELLSELQRQAKRWKLRPASAYRKGRLTLGMRQERLLGTV